MGANSNIQWTDHTFNAWIGCTKISTGCANCYAEELMDGRWKKVSWGKGQPRKQASEAYWKQLAKWDREAAALGRRHKVFHASLADVFDEEVPDSWRDRLFREIAGCQSLYHLVLTKRVPKARSYLWAGLAQEAAFNWPLSNVWLGASVENDPYCRLRLNQLLTIPAFVHFLSVEPLLGEVRIEPFCPGCLRSCVPRPGSKLSVCCGRKCLPDWAIIGGESGHNARECQIEWIARLIENCRAYGIAPFVKQVGKDATQEEHGQRFSLDLVHSKGGKIDEWPPHLQVREFPDVPMTL